MKRIFAALKVHPMPELLQIFGELKKGCRNDRITWVDPANIHITLKFFGETEEERIPAITERLQDIASNCTVFDIHLAGTGVFGSAYHPRVVWIGIEDNPQLNRLGQEVIDEMEHLGFQKDRQNFVPHVTLGRIKSIDNKLRFFDLIRKFRETPFASEAIREFHLIESILSPAGPDYRVLKSFILNHEY